VALPRLDDERRAALGFAPFFPVGAVMISAEPVATACALEKKAPWVRISHRRLFCRWGDAFYVPDRGRSVPNDAGTGAGFFR